jgi:hypothetical protein
MRVYKCPKCFRFKLFKKVKWIDDIPHGVTGYIEEKKCGDCAMNELLKAIGI